MERLERKTTETTKEGLEAIEKLEERWNMKENNRFTPEAGTEETRPVKLISAV